MINPARQEVVSKIMSGDTSSTSVTPMHPMDAHLASLMLSHIAPISPTSAEFAGIAGYARDTELRQSTFAIDIQNVFRIERCVFLARGKCTY
jgi:poly [ADP-ribose] polymerase